MDADKLYRISIFEEEKFKRYVAKLGIDDLKELKNYFDKAQKIKYSDLKIRLANYNYLISYINHDYLTAYTTDDQTMNRIKLEEQKKSSMEKLRRMADGKMKHVIAKYRTAQKVPVRIILTTRENYNVTLGSSMTWREMKSIYDKGSLGSDGLFACNEILNIDSYRKTSLLDLGSGKSLVIRNSQIIGMLIDEETMMANIKDFVSELLAVTDKYDLSDYEIDNYFNLAEEE